MANPRFIKTFGLCAALLASLSACTYFIPEDPSAPRYNQVLGERHRPERNVNMPDGPQSDNSAAVNAFTNPAYQSPAPVMPVTQSNLPSYPPVDAATQARAEREMAMNTMPAIAERRAPVENPVDLAQVDITTVPPRPVMSGAGATTTRMDDVRRDLEHERATSRDLKSQLATDAANEPSAIDTPVERPAPRAPEPIGAVPAPAPAPAPMSSVAPPAPPAPPSYIAPVPPMASSVTYNPMAERIAVQDTPPPAAPAAIEPIRLTAPSAAVANVPEPIFVPSPAMPTAPMASGSFDPFATKPAAAARASKAAYAGSDFLPTSRYASKRD